MATIQLKNSQGITLLHMPPACPSDVWNVYEATLDGNCRTNNVCKSWNDKFVNLIGHNHPSIRKCIERFQKDPSLVETI
ncbi:hypothetical protein Hamer_G030733, partial [Homarus americanus]